MSTHLNASSQKRHRSSSPCGIPFQGMYGDVTDIILGSPQKPLAEECTKNKLPQGCWLARLLLSCGRVRFVYVGTRVRWSLRLVFLFPRTRGFRCRAHKINIDQFSRRASYILFMPSGFMLSQLLPSLSCPGRAYVALTSHPGGGLLGGLCGGGLGLEKDRTGAWYRAVCPKKSGVRRPSPPLIGVTTGSIGVTAALESLESISYARLSCLMSYRASTDTNSFFRLPEADLNRSTQPVTIDQRPRRRRSQMPLICTRTS